MHAALGWPYTCEYICALPNIHTTTSVSCMNAFAFFISLASFCHRVRTVVRPSIQLLSYPSGKSLERAQTKKKKLFGWRWAWGKEERSKKVDFSNGDGGCGHSECMQSYMLFACSMFCHLEKRRQRSIVCLYAFPIVASDDYEGAFEPWFDPTFFLILFSLYSVHWFLLTRFLRCHLIIVGLDICDVQLWLHLYV